MGLVAAAAIRHAYAHFRPDHHEHDQPHATTEVVHVPLAVKQRLLETAESNFQKVLDRTAVALQNELDTTAKHINIELEKIGSKIVNDEMERYALEIEKLKQQAETSFSGAEADVTKHQAELTAKITEQQALLETQLTEKMAEKEQIMLQNLDAKLSDAVVSFLTETLQHNVDLGAQSAYLTTMLDEHKAEIIKGISGED
jgi:hypothetical protein